MSKKIVQNLTISNGSGSHPVLQQVRGVVRGPLSAGQRGLGPLQLCHSGQLPGEALLVPRTHLQVRDQNSSLHWAA